MTTRPDPNILISRVRRTLNYAMGNENYYLAHQLYLSLYSRYVLNDSGFIDWTRVGHANICNINNISRINNCQHLLSILLF